jgi:phosphate transport system substrate-binding protein
VKAIQVSYDKGKSSVEPSVVTAKNGTYPVVRPLYFYYITNKEKVVKAFIDYVLSAQGQKIVSETGFIAL